MFQVSYDNYKNNIRIIMLLIGLCSVIVCSASDDQLAALGITQYKADRLEARPGEDNEWLYEYGQNTETSRIQDVLYANHKGRRRSSLSVQKNGAKRQSRSSIQDIEEIKSAFFKSPVPEGDCNANREIHASGNRPRSAFEVVAGVSQGESEHKFFSGAVCRSHTSLAKDQFTQVVPGSRTGSVASESPTSVGTSKKYSCTSCWNSCLDGVISCLYSCRCKEDV